MRDFDHRRLEVYRVAMEFVAEAEPIAEMVAGGRAPLADQLRRAAASICLNIAEGSGEYSSHEKARFYRIARRSAAECAAILDVAEAIGLCDASAATQGRTQLLRMIAMLTRLILRATG
jgi:four helix bundle protein